MTVRALSGSGFMGNDLGRDPATRRPTGLGARARGGSPSGVAARHFPDGTPATLPRRAAVPPVRARPRSALLRGQSQANFTANTAAITKTPAEHSLPRPASTLLTT